MLLSMYQRNKTAGFTDQQRDRARDGMTKVLQTGFVDSFRHLYPNKKGSSMRFSFHSDWNSISSFTEDFLPSFGRCLQRKISAGKFLFCCHHSSYTSLYSLLFSHNSYRILDYFIVSKSLAEKIREYYTRCTVSGDRVSSLIGFTLPHGFCSHCPLVLHTEVAI